MEIKKIQGIIISSLFVAGLSGCSGSSSYTHDDSPWKAKRDAESANVVSEEFIEVSLDEAVEVNAMEDAQAVEEYIPDPDMAMEPEVQAQPELESVADFDAEPVPVESMSAFERLELEAAEPEVMESLEEAAPVVANSSDIMSAQASGYAVQVYAGRVLANVNRYQSTHGLDAMQIVATNHDGETIHVLVGIYDDLGSARQAAEDIEASTGSRPWVRSVSGLQNMAVQ